MALTDAERAARYRARRASAEPVVKYRRPADRRSRVQRWADAVCTLTRLLDEYDAWAANLPEQLGGSLLAERLADVTALREQVDQLAEAELPRGFGRD